MAREIVITSVPRGVKLGRTGFQVAMRTAGLRDDVSAALERMAGYRHVAAGHGANPVCYFHRRDRTTGAGPIHVVGRIVDAGVDFSNRSNKLAHMVILEPADLGQVAASSPAGLLAAIEERLATRWTEGPEERQSPFNLAGIPASNPAPCAAWQQAMGDAGWAGVIAERALANLPTLLIGPDHSPASCRRMLTLFEEALAIVPPAKRWEITFDTTTLDPNGILWRGTYAGSPESQALQPGLLVVDLRRPQPIPADMAAGPLVNAARTGAGPVLASRVPVTPSGIPPVGGQPGGGDLFAGIDGRGSVVCPPPPPGGGGIPPPAKQTSRWLLTMLAVTVTAVVLLLLAGVGVGAFIWRQGSKAQGDALQRIKDYAEKNEGAKPTQDDIRTARGAWSKDDISNEVEKKKYLTFLNAVLASPKITAQEVVDTEALEGVLSAVADVMTKWPHGSKKPWPDQFRKLGTESSPAVARLLAEFHPDPFSRYEDFIGWIDDIAKLVALPTTTESKIPDAVPQRIWDHLLKNAGVEVPDGDSEPVRGKFAKALTSEDVRSWATLCTAVRRCTPEKQPSPAEPPKTDGATAGSSDAQTLGTGTSSRQPGSPTQPEKNPEEAFAALQKELRKLKNKAPGLPQIEKPVELFCIGQQAARDLDAEVVVGTLPGFPATVKSDGKGKNWSIMLGDRCLLVLTLEDDGRLILKRAEEDETQWREHERDLHFMPVGLKRRDRPWIRADYVVLSQPERRRLESASGETLQALLCEDRDSVPLPKIEPPGATVTWKPRPDPIDAPPLRVSVARAADGTGFQLAFTATVGGTDFTLTELTDVLGEVKSMRRRREPWPKRPPLFGEFLLKIKSSDAMREFLGLAKAKDSTVSFEDIPKWNSPDSRIPLLVHWLLGKGIDLDNVKLDTVKNNALAQWCPVSGSSKNEQYRELRSLQHWGEFLRQYLVDDEAFRAEMEQEFVLRNGRKPRSPAAYSPPAQEAGESADAYSAREKDAKASHEKDRTAGEDWSRRLAQFVADATRSPEALGNYLEKHKRKPGDKQPIDATTAAIRVLLELDGLIVAKAYRDELEMMLPRIPIAALFEGEATCEWTVETDGKKTVLKVPVARLLPADLLPVKADDPARGP